MRLKRNVQTMLTGGTSRERKEYETTIHHQKKSQNDSSAPRLQMWRGISKEKVVELFESDSKISLLIAENQQRKPHS